MTFFFTTPEEQGCSKCNEKGVLKAVTKVEVKVEGAVAVIFSVSRLSLCLGSPH
jgi:hypothetical protein